MKYEVPPFAWINGRPYLIANFALTPPVASLDPREILEKLLSRYPVSEILLLRPLDPDEAALLKQNIQNAERETWAQMPDANEFGTE
jgi:hypothetical protein